jgi:hypothetical protein
MIALDASLNREKLKTTLILMAYTRSLCQPADCRHLQDGAEFLNTGQNSIWKYETVERVLKETQADSLFVRISSIFTPQSTNIGKALFVKQKEERLGKKKRR